MAVGGAVVVVLQLQFIDKVVDVLMQLKFQQSRGVYGQFIDRVLDISVAHREVPTVQTVQKDVLGVDVPVISSDRFPQSRGSNLLAPDSVHPLSGGHPCCATDFVVFHRCSSWCSGQLLTCPYVYNDRCAAFSRISLFST